MAPRLSAREVESVPEQASVRDFDQLDTDTKQSVVELAREETALEVPADVATALSACELVKYTRYLRVRVSGTE